MASLINVKHTRGDWWLCHVFFFKCHKLIYHWQAGMKTSRSAGRRSDAITHRLLLWHGYRWPPCLQRLELRVCYFSDGQQLLCFPDEVDWLHTVKLLEWVKTRKAVSTCSDLSPRLHLCTLSSHLQLNIHMTFTTKPCSAPPTHSETPN